MPEATPRGTDTEIQGLLDRSLKGDVAAREALLDRTGERFLLLTRQMLRTFPSVRRWEQTDDVFQQAMIRMSRALTAVKFKSVKEFLGLGAVQIRRELINLRKHYYGPQGSGTHHHTDRFPPQRGGSVLDAQPERQQSPCGDLHDVVDGLPEEEREIIHLLYYQGLTQEEAARVVGVSLSTLLRRWQKIRLKLGQELRS